MEEHPEARSIIETLRKKGFIAYYAGGWVRDFLLNLPSDDIDIATDAPAKEVQKIFEKTIPIGIAFGIVLVVIQEKQYEVATFRRDLEYADGRRPSKVEFSSPKEDAKRRDFTINGMFYDPIEKKVLDYIDGQKDLDRKIIRAIGNPHERIQEDRLRMIRAIRLSCRFRFAIEKKTKEAILSHQKELFPAVAIERVTQEFTKMHITGHLKDSLILLFEYGLLKQIFPQIEYETQKSLTKTLEVLDDFPSDAPLILSLMQLFPKIELDMRLMLCEYLKCSNVDKEIVQFYYSYIPFYKSAKNISLHQWAHFYSHKYHRLSLEVFSCHLPKEKRKAFFQDHDDRKITLHSAIFRIQNHQPILNSDYLRKKGISPGPKMGKLLKKAEEIAINERLEDPDRIFSKLKPYLDVSE